MQFFIAFPMTQVVFPINEFEILPFFYINSFIGKFKQKKNVLAGAYKKFERVQHTEIYLIGPKVQYKHKMKLPPDMVSKHVL